MMMQQSIETLHQQFVDDLQKIASTSDLEELRVKYLGKKSPIQSLMKSLKDVSAEERPAVGKQINDLKETISAQLDTAKDKFTQQEETEQLKSEQIDITLPGRRRFPGRKHVITQTLDDMIDILSGMGFSVQYGPDIDTDYYNYEALNFPFDHPARDMQDTFYISPSVLLRTHTSNVQVRVMENQKPPIRVIAPGKVYRNEAISARSHVFFHQLEAFYIDKDVTFADLFATLDEFLEKLFHQKIETRYRPSYFPFVEPGIEVDISCLSCSGKGCGLCKHTGWLEVAGAGMIHPEVLKNGDIDPEVYSGYAWGLGIDRLALLKYGINDIRMLTENDLRFLRQFSAV
ncbi:MAG: phenylalanine--tRNA ligase subunit alpha [Parachlamydiaceae bacterium]|nr:phenylalanine--tRNA ligase subunit alpha [Parachlamydiaceae bacterium]